VDPRVEVRVLPELASDLRLELVHLHRTSLPGLTLKSDQRAEDEVSYSTMDVLDDEVTIVRPVIDGMLLRLQARYLFAF